MFLSKRGCPQPLLFSVFKSQKSRGFAIMIISMEIVLMNSGTSEAAALMSDGKCTN